MSTVSMAETGRRASRTSISTTKHKLGLECAMTDQLKMVTGADLTTSLMQPSAATRGASKVGISAVPEFRLVNPENPDLCDFSKSQWYTPDALAERIVLWALKPHEQWRGQHGLIEMNVLEPSAGRGALLRYIAREVLEFHCFDIDPRNIPSLREFCSRAECLDFLKREPARSYDLAIMNSPFEDGATEAHVLHALKFAERVVAHVPLTTLAGKDRREGLWSEAYLKRLAIHSTRAKYSGSKTVGQTDMCTIDICRRPENLPLKSTVAASGVDIEWWT